MINVSGTLKIVGFENVNGKNFVYVKWDENQQKSVRMLLSENLRGLDLINGKAVKDLADKTFEFSGFLMFNGLVCITRLSLSDDNAQVVDTVIRISKQSALSKKGSSRLTEFDVE